MDKNELIQERYKNCGKLSDETELWIKNDFDFKDLIDVYIINKLGYITTLYPSLYSKEIIKKIASNLED